MSDKTMFPCAYPEWQEKRIDTTFWQDFTIADKFGLNAVKDTYNRAFEGWKDNIKYLVELCSVMNHKCWWWHNHDGGESPFSQYYADRFNEIREFVYGDDDKTPSPFTSEELRFFMYVLD